MESTEQKSQGRTTRISLFPNEMLLKIFILYRQSIDQYDHLWRKKYVWLNLAHVCRRWRAVMFASSSHLDLNVIVGPEKPSDIKTILSHRLPIHIDYSDLYRLGDITDSTLWRMRAALGHRDRVREIYISFDGSDVTFKSFIGATTNHHFPALERLALSIPRTHEHDLPATFLRGPDRSDLPLRCLTLYGVSFASVSRLLLSATALTDLSLSIRYTDFESSQGSSLLACLRGTQCLRSLDLTTPYVFGDFEPLHPTPKDIVSLLRLTRFLYSGPTAFLNDFMSGLSAPFLQDARFKLGNKSPLLYLSRVIDDVMEEFRSVSITFEMDHFHLISSFDPGEIDHFKPESFDFRFNANCSPYSIDSMSSTPSTKLAEAEELTLNFPGSNLTSWEQVFSLREFLRQFRSVKLLRVNPFVRQVGLYLKQDDGEAILPVLEQVELSISSSTRYSNKGYQDRVAEALAAFQPCERAGRVVNVCHSKQTETQSRNARSW